MTSVDKQWRPAGAAMEGAEGRLISQPIWSTEKKRPAQPEAESRLELPRPEKGQLRLSTAWEVQATESPWSGNKRTDQCLAPCQWCHRFKKRKKLRVTYFYNSLVFSGWRLAWKWAILWNHSIHEASLKWLPSPSLFSSFSSLSLETVLPCGLGWQWT